MKICKVKNCDNKHEAKGYCKKHYQQLLKYGGILIQTRFDSNKIIDYGDYLEICLYFGLGEQQEIAEAKIDKEDLDKVKKYKWSLSKGYAITAINNKTIGLHQLILGKKEKYITDHINHDKLDNRKQNLRFVTVSQNGMNRKNAKGYYWNKKNKKWQVYICIDYKHIYLGCFINKLDAIKARRQAELKYFGEFAYNIC